MKKLVKRQAVAIQTSIAVEKFEFTEGQSVKCLRAGFVPERIDKLVDGAVYTISSIRRSTNGRNSDLVSLEGVAGWWSAIRFEPVKTDTVSETATEDQTAA